MDPVIEIKKSKKRKNFLDVKIRNNLIMEFISTQMFHQYKALDLTTDQLPVLVMDVFERIHSKKHLTNNERNLITKNIILKLYPILKQKMPLNKENLKLNDIEVLDNADISEEIVNLISSLVECFSTLKKKPLIQTKGCFRILLGWFLKIFR